MKSLSDFVAAIKMVMDHHSDLVFVKDQSMKYVYANKSYLEITIVEDLDGKSDDEIGDIINLEDHKKTDRQILNGQLQQLDYEVEIEQEGEVRSTLLFTKSAIVDENGEVIGIYGSGRSIDDQIAMQEGLKFNLNVVEAILDTVPYPLFIKSKDGIFLRVNEAYKSVVSLTDEQILGKTDYDIHPPEEAKFYRMKDEAILESGKRESYISNRLGSDKRDLVTKDLIRDEQGNVYGIVGIVNPYLDLSDISQELLNSQKIESISKLAGGIAHDLNNLLTNITGLSSIMLLDEQDAKKKEYVITIYDAAKEAASLIQNLQTFAQIETTELQLRTISMTKIARDVIRLVQTNYTQQIQFLTTIEDDIYVKGDYTQLTQMSMNLILNAIESLDGTSKGEVIIRLDHYDGDLQKEDFIISSNNSKETTFCCLEIIDTGHGISDYELSNIFDPYYTTKKVPGRSGLGLSIVHGVISTHSGYLQVTSELGEGTTFKVLLPMLENPQQSDGDKQPV